MIQTLQMNKLFYIVYNSYYKHGQFKNDIPSLTVAGIFAIMFFSLILFGLFIIGWIYPEYAYAKISKSNKSIHHFIAIFCCLVTYFAFYYNKRYIKIYQTYKDSEFLNSSTAKFQAFLFIVLVILSPIILALIQNKVTLGHWPKFV